MSKKNKYPILVLAFSLLFVWHSSTAWADQCKLIVASRTTVDEGKELAVEYGQRFEIVELIQATNGRFAISLGTLSLPSGSDMSVYIERFNLPTDSFCMRMDRVARHIGFEQRSQPPETIPPTENTFGMKSCPRGYRTNGFPITSCTEIKLPPHAELNYSGNGWNCSSGYIQRESQCEFVEVPNNAHLTQNTLLFAGAKGWACNRGFREVENKCERVVVPENAALNVFGNGYNCNTGFVDIGNRCRSMTYDELVRNLANAERFAAALLSRGSGKSCSEIVDLCEDTCDDEFTSYSSPTENECEEVCEEIEDNC